MGNHHAGNAIGKAALDAEANRNGRTALQILDEICEPWRGHDAEFESEDPDKPGHVHPDYDDWLHPLAPLGKLIAEAFGESGHDYAKGFDIDNEGNGRDSEDPEHAVEVWYEGPLKSFRRRYDFC